MGEWSDVTPFQIICVRPPSDECRDILQLFVSRGLTLDEGNMSLACHNHESSFLRVILRGGAYTGRLPRRPTRSSQPTAGFLFIEEIIAAGGYRAWIDRQRRPFCDLHALAMYGYAESTDSTPEVDRRL